MKTIRQSIKLYVMTNELIHLCFYLLDVYYNRWSSFYGKITQHATCLHHNSYKVHLELPLSFPLMDKNYQTLEESPASTSRWADLKLVDRQELLKNAFRD